MNQRTEIHITLGGLSALAIVLAATLALCVSEARGAEPGEKALAHAYCEDLESLTTMRDTLIEADRLDWTRGRRRGDNYYRHFVVGETRCHDAELSNAPALIVVRVAPVLSPAARRGRHEIVFWRVYDQTGRTLFVWNLRLLKENVR